jgi:hypothetical protein
MYSPSGVERYSVRLKPHAYSIALVLDLDLEPAACGAQSSRPVGLAMSAQLGGKLIDSKLRLSPSDGTT